jgi:hypothetical protein
MGIPLSAPTDLLDVPRALDEPEAAHDGPRPAAFDDVAAHVAVAPHHGVHHRREGDAVGAQTVRVDVDLVLAHYPPDAGHLGHAGHGVELVADVPVLDGPEVPERVPRALHRVPEHVADTGGVGAERRDDAGRKRSREQAEALQHARAGEVEIDPDPRRSR